MLKNNLFRASFGVLVLTLASISFADIAVIVNPGNGISNLSDKDLKRVYLGKTSTLPGGVGVVLSDQKFGADRKSVV